MAHRTPAQHTAYPSTLTEIERVEIASALSYHFDQCEGGKSFLGAFDMSRETQYMIVCGIVERMLRRRAGLL